MWAGFTPAMVGVFNNSRVNDSELDELIAVMVSELDPELQQQAANDVQRRVVEQAYTVPLYAVKRYSALNTRVKGALYSKSTQSLTLFNIFIEMSGQ